MSKKGWDFTLQAGLSEQESPKGGAIARHPHPPPLCVEMGFYADISWESRWNIERNVWAHFYKILLVFEVPYQPWVKRMPGKS